MSQARAALIGFLGGAASGAFAGASAADTEFHREVFRALVDILDKHGLPVALSFGLVLATVALVYYLLNKLIEGQNAEIRRLAGLRDELWEQYIRERPSSGGGSRP